MGAGLAGRPPCLPHSQALMGAGLAGRPPVYHIVRSLWEQEIKIKEFREAK